jgi:2'-5' RNA ligase
MYTSYGTLRYSPKLLGNSNDKWWLIVDADSELARYYRSLLKSHRFNTFSLTTPSWKQHITVVRNEESIDKLSWEKYHGQKVEFQYENKIYNNLAYYWLNVSCQKLYDIRVELGLPKEPEFPFHLTIGNDLNFINNPSFETFET